VGLTIQDEANLPCVTTGQSYTGQVQQLRASENRKRGSDRGLDDIKEWVAASFAIFSQYY